MARNSKLISLTVLLTLAVLFIAPAVRADRPGIRHTVFMAGSVIEASPEGIYLCIGTSDGAAPGQVLEVIRVTRDRSSQPKRVVRFHREKVGKVKVEAIVDEHFARATLLDGKVELGDLVRLTNPEETKQN